MQMLKLTAVGTSIGAIIPKEMLARLKVGKGDRLFAVETPVSPLRQLAKYCPAMRCTPT